MKSSLALVSDLVFTTVIVFIILTVILGYFILYPFYIILSLTGTALFLLFCARFLIGRFKKQQAKAKERKEKEQMTTALNLMDKKELSSLFIRALNKKGYSTEEKNGNLAVKNERAVIYLFFEFTRVKKADVVRSFNQSRSEKAVIFSDEFSAEIKDFALRFGGKVELVDQNKIYSLLKSTNLLPKIEPVKNEKEKKTLRQAIKDSIKKVNAKKFFLFGIAFLFFSYFAPIKIYYLLSGSVFLAVALLCKLAVFTEKKEGN